MESSKYFGAILLTLIFHGILLFGVRNQIFLKDVSLLNNNDNSVKAILKTQVITDLTDPVMRPFEKINKKAIPKKAYVKKTVGKVIPVERPLKKPIKPNVDLKKIERYALELREFIEKNKFYFKMAKRLRQSELLQLNIVINEFGLFENISMKETTPFPILKQGGIKSR